MYDPVSAQMIANAFLVFLGAVFAFSVLIGYCEGETPKERSYRTLLESIDDQDLYAALTGDEEYLAAHFTLKEEPLPVKTNTGTRVTPPSEQDSNLIRSRVKPKQQAKPKQVKPCTTDVGREAAMGLVSLGYKKSDANRLVNDILTNNPNMTSDQVIIQVFNK